VKTALLQDDLFLEHDTGEGHPESARRLRRVYQHLDEQPVEGCVLTTPRLATRAEILRVHDETHVDAVARTANQGRVVLETDTVTSPLSYEAALLAAGATMKGVESVLEGTSRHAFALVRPPGHHAEKEHAQGFCLFNNVAIAAAHALDGMGLERVLILDPDVHHGNGTQHAFWERPDVLYVSSHRYPFYPGTGAINEMGYGDGAGYTLNLPLPEGATDADFFHLYAGTVERVVDAFRPELILVSAGFDTWMHDPIGGMRQTTLGFRALYALFRKWADRHCPNRLVLALEGGYDPGGLARCVRTTLEVLAADETPEANVEGQVSEAALHVAHRLKHDLAHF